MELSLLVTADSNIDTTPYEVVVTEKGEVIKNRHGALLLDNDLQCQLVRLMVKHELVTMHFPEMECCDMKAAIALACAICPGVMQIQTWSGDAKDTSYKKKAGGWVAIRSLVLSPQS